MPTRLNTRSQRVAACGLLFLICLTRLAQTAEFERALHLWQTNSSGNDIHIVDLEEMRVLDRLVVGPEPHGIAVPEDGSVVYVSLESNDRERGELLWIDPAKRKILHRLDVGPEPHAIATTPDGHWIYVPCRDGNYWIVDGWERKVVKKIHTGGRPHNTRASADGRWMYLSPMGEPKRVTIVDVHADHRVVDHLPFSESVRPSALEPDGKRFFQHVDGLYGFEVADIASRENIARIEHRRRPSGFQIFKKAGWLGLGGFQRCHGLAIRPDGKEIWSCCADTITIHDLTDDAYQELATIDLPGKAYWITFSPEGRWAAVALSGLNQVVLIDTESRKIAHRFDVGEKPKRNVIFHIPAGGEIPEGLLTGKSKEPPTRSQAGSKSAIIALSLIVLWTLESVAPLAAGRRRRGRHALNNLALGAGNALIVSVFFGCLLIGLMETSDRASFGLLHRIGMTGAPAAIIAFLLLDAWQYFWHLIHHRVPLLWRFHAVHHSDRDMDASSAVRFHTAEIVLAHLARMAVLPLLGLLPHHVLIYECVMFPVILFHHSNVRISERLDRTLRWVIVTPGMHWLHHSEEVAETNSNYASVFSFWDRLARTYSVNRPAKEVQLGLKGLIEDDWNSVRSALLFPFSRKKLRASNR